MPQGSYLVKPVSTVSALLNEFDISKQVRERYARTFKMPPALVRAAFTRLEVIQLPQDRIYQVHYIHPGEQIGYKLRRVKQGTWIYALADGTPALARICGNPLRKHPGLGPIVTKPLANLPIPTFSPTESLQPVSTPAVIAQGGMRSVPPSVISPPTVPGIPAPPMLSMGFVPSPDVIPPESIPSLPLVSPGPLPLEATTHLSNWLGNIPWGFPAAALGVLPFFGFHSSGSSSSPAPQPGPSPAPGPKGGPTPPPPGPTPGPTPIPIPIVPEGDGLLLLVVGTLPLVLYRMIARRLTKITLPSTSKRPNRT